MSFRSCPVCVRLAWNSVRCWASNSEHHRQTDRQIPGLAERTMLKNLHFSTSSFPRCNMGRHRDSDSAGKRGGGCLEGRQRPDGREDQEGLVGRQPGLWERRRRDRARKPGARESDTPQAKAPGGRHPGWTSRSARTDLWKGSGHPPQGRRETARLCQQGSRSRVEHFQTFSSRPKGRDLSFSVVEKVKAGVWLHFPLRVGWHVLVELNRPVPDWLPEVNPSAVYQPCPLDPRRAPGQPRSVVACTPLPVIPAPRCPCLTRTVTVDGSAHKNDVFNKSPISIELFNMPASPRKKKNSENLVFNFNSRMDDQNVLFLFVL